METVQRRINISRIFRFALIFLLMILSAFVIQYYNDSRKELDVMYGSLRTAVFLKDGLQEDQVINRINEIAGFKDTEFVDSESAYDRAAELSPELQEIFPDEKISYPSYVLALYPDTQTMAGLNLIKNRLLQLEFVDDVFYDENAFRFYFGKNKLYKDYKKVFAAVSAAVILLFFMKLAVFLIKKSYKEILCDIALGCCMSCLAYVTILLASAVKYSPVFAVDYQILYILIPFGCIAGFIAKETNA